MLIERENILYGPNDWNDTERARITAEGWTVVYASRLSSGPLAGFWDVTMERLVDAQQEP
jgi:hypothetical protein